MSAPHASPSRVPVGGTLSGPVVVGYDGTPAAGDALTLGRQLSALTGEPLYVAVVQPLDLYVAPDPVLVSDLDAAQYEAVDGLIAQAAGVLGGEEGRDWRRSVVAARSPALGLHRVIDGTGAGIVVLGRTHRQGRARAFPGTTAGRLLHGSPCPVAVAPPGWAARADGIARFAAGVDGSAESLAALRLAARLAASSHTAAQAVMIYERPNPADPAYAMTTKGYTEALADLRSVVEHRVQAAVDALPAGAAEALVLEGHPVEELVRHAGRCDLLVVGSRGYGPLHSVVVGDVATALASEAPSALIVVPRGAGGG